MYWIFICKKRQITLSFNSYVLLFDKTIWFCRNLYFILYKSCARDEDFYGLTPEFRVANLSPLTILAELQPDFNDELSWGKSKV